jgi:hypothetical protein
VNIAQNQRAPLSLAGAILASLALLASPACAQQEPRDPTKETAPANAATPAQTVSKPQSGTSKPQSGTSKDRLFFALPNFLTIENAGQMPPLTTGQKFKTVAQGAFDYIQIPWYGFLAGINQAQNSEPGYGQGAEGYGKRFAASFADGTIENFMVGAALPSLLHQDPRFYQSGKGGFMHRLVYAASRIVITRGDSGGAEGNYSEIVGSALSAGLSTYTYHPHADRTLVNTTKVWGTQVGYDTITLVVKEFWPDIRRKITHKPKTGAAGP